MSQYRTVVFQVSDTEQFDKLWGDLCDSMRDGKPVSGAFVCGLSLEDEMTKLEELEEKMEQQQ